MAKHTIGRWPVVVSHLGILASSEMLGRSLYCKNRRLGDVWHDDTRGPQRRKSVRPWRAFHARNSAISYHRTMTDAIADIVCTETQFPTQEYR